MVNLFINCIMFNKENCSWFDLNLCLMLSGLNNFHFKCILALLFGCSFSGQKNQRTINEFLKDVVKKTKEAVVCQGDIMFLFWLTTLLLLLSLNGTNELKTAVLFIIICSYTMLYIRTFLIIIFWVCKFMYQTRDRVIVHSYGL